MKHIHRMLVTSAAYRMTSSVGNSDNSNLAIDSENRFLWRMNSRRMEAEVVRDSLLHVSGELDTKMGGPELAETLGEQSGRRSLYFRTTPDNKMEMLELFDLANPNQCYDRKVSVVPQQALALSNSHLALGKARKLARDISTAIGAEVSESSQQQFIQTAFETVLNRSPSADELSSCRRFIAKQIDLLTDVGKLTPFPSAAAKSIPSSQPNLRARENLVHVLFNHNDFVTIR